MSSVALVVSSLGAGGAERAVAVLANGWAELGWRVTVVTFEDGKSDHYVLDPAVERVALNLFWPSQNVLQSIRNTFIRIRRIRTEVEKRKPAVILSFIEQTNVRVLAAMAGSPIPVIVSEQIDPRRYGQGTLWRLLGRLLYLRAASVVVLTEAVRRDWALKLFRSERVRVIPNPLYSLPEPRLSSDDDRTLLAVGRLDRQKGFDLLLHAFAESGLPRQGWRLRILGEGHERVALAGLASELKVSDHVEMPGAVAEPADYMRQGGIFVFSSRFEGFGNALLEAMGMGMAAVSFDCDSGPREIIHHDENGLLVPAEDVPALAATLADLAGDPARRQRLGARALEVRQRYGVGTILGEWSQIIDSVTNRGSK